MKIKKLTPLDLAARRLFKKSVGNVLTHDTHILCNGIYVDTFEKQQVAGFSGNKLKKIKY